MAVGILVHGLPKKRFCRLADCPISDAEWPLGEPKECATLGDLSDEDQLVITISSRSLLADRRGLRCRVSALIFEPPAIHQRYYNIVRMLGGSYHRVLTHNSRLLQRLPNARFLPHGGCWLKEIPGAEHPKTGLLSLIASKKRDTAGHRLRHRLAAWSAEKKTGLELFGRGYRPLDDKADGHSPFRYSVVLENSREPGYFTEKLVDSLLCMSLPIYWGAPDIAHFFDPRGLIVCNTEADLREAVLGASEADYAARLPFLEENRRRAITYADRRRNAALLLQREDDFATRAA